MAFDPLLATLTLGNGLVFLKEQRGSLGKGLFVLEDAGAGLAPQFEEPVLSELLGLGKAFFLSCDAVLAVVQRGGAMPEAPTALVDLHQSAKDFVARHGRYPPSLRKITRGGRHVTFCVRCVIGLFGERGKLGLRLTSCFSYRIWLRG